MGLAEQIGAYLEDLSREVAAAGTHSLDEIAEEVRDEAEETWPGTDRAEIHIYARDRSKRMWRISSPSPLRRVVENEADWSGYTEGGFTRRGEGTAGPWETRGSRRYLRTVGEAVVLKRMPELAEHLAARARGR